MKQFRGDDINSGEEPSDDEEYVVVPAATSGITSEDDETPQIDEGDDEELESAEDENTEEDDPEEEEDDEDEDEEGEEDDANDDVAKITRPESLSPGKSGRSANSGIYGAARGVDLSEPLSEQDPPSSLREARKRDAAEIPDNQEVLRNANNQASSEDRKAPLPYSGRPVEYSTHQPAYWCRGVGPTAHYGSPTIGPTHLTAEQHRPEYEYSAARPMDSFTPGSSTPNAERYMSTASMGEGCSIISQRVVSSTILQDEFSTKLPTPEVRYIEVPVHEEVVRHVTRKEYVEVEKHVPKIETVYVEKIVEVPDIQYVDRHVDVEQVQEVVREVRVKSFVDVPVDVVRHVPRVVDKIVEKTVEVPGPVEEKTIPYTVEQEVVVSNFVDKPMATVVAQTLRPSVVNSDNILEVRACRYEPTLIPVDVFVPLPVHLPAQQMHLQNQKHDLVHISAEHFNTLSEKMNQHIDYNDHQKVLKFVKKNDGSIPMLPVSEKITLVTPVNDSWRTHYKSQLLVHLEGGTLINERPAPIKRHSTTPEHSMKGGYSHTASASGMYGSIPQHLAYASPQNRNPTKGSEYTTQMPIGGYSSYTGNKEYAAKGSEYTTQMPTGGYSSYTGNKEYATKGSEYTTQMPTGGYSSYTGNKEYAKVPATKGSEYTSQMPTGGYSSYTGNKEYNRGEIKPGTPVKYGGYTTVKDEQYSQPRTSTSQLPTTQLPSSRQVPSASQLPATGHLRSKTTSQPSGGYTISQMPSGGLNQLPSGASSYRDSGGYVSKVVSKPGEGYKSSAQTVVPSGGHNRNTGQIPSGGYSGKYVSTRPKYTSHLSSRATQPAGTSITPSKWPGVAKHTTTPSGYSSTVQPVASGAYTSHQRSHTSKPSNVYTPAQPNKAF